MATQNSNGERNSERKGESPVFERRLKDIRIACWRNQVVRSGDTSKGDSVNNGTSNSDAEPRVWFHTILSRAWRKGDDIHEAPGSLNGLADIALAMAALNAAKEFIERQTEA